MQFTPRWADRVERPARRGEWSSCRGVGFFTSMLGDAGGLAARLAPRVEPRLQELEAALEGSTVGLACELRRDECEDHVAQLVVQLTCVADLANRRSQNGDWATIEIVDA